MSVLLPLAVLAGLILGPTLHHLAVRAGARAPFEGPVPLCGECGARRSTASWFRRVCRECGETVRRWETVATITAGAVFGGFAASLGPSWVLPAFLFFAAVTLVLVITDFDHKLIPNRVLYPGFVIGLVLLTAGAAADGRLADMGRALGGAAAYFGVFFLVALVARGGFGFGDVKLAALLGLFTAFESMNTFLLSVFLTGVYGGVPAIAMLLSRRRTGRDELPYGPAMVAGAWTAIVFADRIAGFVTG